MMNMNKKLSTLLIIPLLALMVSACSVSAVQTPSRTVTITLDDALAGQNALLTGLTTGEATLTEVQFSSFLSKLLEANSGPNSPVAQVTAWFEPDQLYLRLTLKEGVLGAGLGNTLDLVGGVTIDKGVLHIDLAEAAAGPYRVTGDLLQPLAAQINAALAQQIAALPLEITLKQGELNIHVVR